MAPPLVGVAVKVTLPPEHIVVEEAVMLTLAVTVGVTTIVIELEVAGLPVTQLALDVRTQLTTSLLFSVADEKVEELVPVFVPFTFHW